MSAPKKVKSLSNAEKAVRSHFKDKYEMLDHEDKLLDELFVSTKDQPPKSSYHPEIQRRREPSKTAQNSPESKHSFSTSSEVKHISGKENANTSDVLDGR